MESTRTLGGHSGAAWIKNNHLGAGASIEAVSNAPYRFPESVTVMFRREAAPGDDFIYTHDRAGSRSRPGRGGDAFEGPGDWQPPPARPLEAPMARQGPAPADRRTSGRGQAAACV